LAVRSILSDAHENRGHLDLCHLKGREDAANVVLSAVGHNLRLVLAWRRDAVAPNLDPLVDRVRRPKAIKSAS
jgi:hypothetical protein